MESDGRSGVIVLVEVSGLERKPQVMCQTGKMCADGFNGSAQALIGVTDLGVERVEVSSHTAQRPVEAADDFDHFREGQQMDLEGRMVL